VVLVGAVVAFFTLEGIYAVVENEAKLSLTRRFLYQLRERGAEAGGLDRFIRQESELEDRLELFKRNRVVLGNTPFDELATEEARTVERHPGGGTRFRPNLTVRSGYLRSRIYDALDPITFNQALREGEPPDPELEAFLARHALGVVTWTTDGDGFRTTLPAVAVEPVLAFVGSSPCFGAFLADDETLASVLQRRNPTVRFVNACITWTKVGEHAAMLEGLIAQYGDRLVGVVYTLNERNFKRLDRALAGIDRMAELLDEVGADYRALVYFHSIYETLPDLFRSHRRLGESFGNRLEILARARERCFTTVDTFELVDRYRQQRVSSFAGVELYVDHGHFSGEGNRLVADALPPTPRGGRGG
ncbi:MAG: hypothetical protein ACR2P8_00685, partial [Myxococcota bacterium]